MTSAELERYRVRFLAKTTWLPSGCWEWTAHIKPNGYGAFGIGRRLFYAHRIAYEMFVAPIPDGLHLDHLCRNRACVNPAHLQPVTQRENTLRGEGVSARCAVKTKCIRGHEFTDENTYRRPNGSRECIACREWRRGQRRAT